MIVEMRIYTCYVGRAGSYVAQYKEKGLPIQEPIQGNLLGMYQTEFGPMSQVIVMWGYESEEDRRQRRARLAQAPGWMDFIAEVAPMIQSEESRLLIPA